MGKKICNTIHGMSAKAKTALISLFTLLLTMGMYQGWYLLTSSQAAIGTQTAWTNAFNGTGLAANFTLSVNTTAANRLLVVAVTSSVNVAAAQNCTVTYGGRPLTLAVGNGGTSSTRTHSWLFYLKEADIGARSTNTVSVNCSGSTANSFTAARYTLYTGVDQTNPIKTTGGTGTSTNTTAVNTLGSLSPTISIASGEYGISIINLTRTASNTARTVTASQNWAVAVNGTGTGTNTAFTSTVVTRTVAGNNLACNLALSGTALSSQAAMVVVPAPTITSLSAVNNTAIATGNKLDSDQSVVMQRFTLTASGPLEINSLSLNDIGTATSVDAAEVYISSSPVTTILPADAVLIGRVTSWGGGNYTIPLNMGLASNRTFGGSQALTKHIYITYDMSIGQAGSTVRSQVTGVGVVAPNTSLTGLNLTSNSIGLTASGNILSTLDPVAAASSPVKDSDAAVIMNYFKVSTNAGFDSAAVLSSLTVQNLGNVNGVDSVKVYVDSTYPGTIPTTVPATAMLIGVHGEWLKDQIGDTVVVPLNDDYGTAPIDRTVLTGSPKCIYVVYSMRYEDDGIYASLPQPQTIQSKVLAVGAESPDSGTTGINYLSNTLTLNRGTWSRITSCGGCHDTSNIFDGTARNVPNGKFVGSHRKHTNDYGKDCTDCHARPALTNYGHASGFVNFTSNLVLGYDVSNSYSKGKVFPVSNNPSMGYCSNLYCHSTGTSVATGGAPGTPTIRPTWGGTLGCSGCHGAPPGYLNNSPKKNTHSAGGHQLSCDRCHYLTTTNGSAVSSIVHHNDKNYDVNPNPAYSGTINFTYTYYNDGGECSSNLCHATVKWGGSLPCTGCHAQEVNITVGQLSGQKRRAVATEFTLTWSHKRSGGRTATKEDCIVCHMEGDASSGGTSTLHKNGSIELRDPDTGSTIKGVTFSGTGAGAFSSTAADLTFARFKRDLGVRPESDPDWSILAAIQINQCLKCHDANGAASTAARVPGGTAMKPFNTTIASQTIHSNGSGNVVNVDASFNTSNASYHPVKGRGNNSFVRNARMKGPYTLATDKATTGNTTSWGLLITCWDCHAPLNASGIQTASVTAHGGAVTLRRDIRTAGTAANLNLCIVCHATSYATVSNNHGTGSAFGAGGSSMNGTSTFANCHYCHAYFTSNGNPASGPTSSTRPTRGEDAHGFNGRIPGQPTTKWVSGSRPYSFIRNSLTNWRPANAAPDGLTGTTGTCAGSTGTCDSNMSNRTYAPGGTY